ncbi:MAG: hypothetical protein KGL13_04250 [Gammaproteobacteria bacterium]|nr:hypothetical protein [Gammaproteobacteria bacterium]MDE2345660.1 hypothetical protein [Gammaproteobacteria bacterium]
MAKANYKFDKRQRDLARQKKQEDKRLKKLAKKAAQEPAEASPPSPRNDTA